jgi:hypothetical protein
MRLGNAIRHLRQADFRAYAFNTPEPETAEIEVLVRHPVHGKCPAIRIPIFPREDQRMLDWEVKAKFFPPIGPTAWSRRACL